MKQITLLLLAFFTMVAYSYGQSVNKAPKIELLMIDGKKSPSVVPLNPGEKYLVKVTVTDPEHDVLKAKWELFEKSELSKANGEKRKPVALPDMVTGSLQNVMLDVPVHPGDYKLTLTVSDSNKNTSTASIELRVL
ncbi:MAG: PKD domain-containing protein [Pedobacter sp.]